MKTNPGEGVVHGADSAERIHRNQPSQRQTGDSHRKPFEIRLERSTSTVTDAPFHQLTATDRDPSFLASEDIHSLMRRDSRCPNVSKDSAS
ncbi:MAG: hypothetical protein QOG75_5637 [Mycobacterium sp.]|nr:hypothetical protein [Mycobacterium sp.]